MSTFGAGSDRTYTVCVGFYHNSYSSIEHCGAAILLIPTTNADLYTYKWSCNPDSKYSSLQVWRQSRLPRNFKDNSLKAVLKLGLLSEELSSGLRILDSIFEYAVDATDIGQPSDQTCPPWLEYVLNVRIVSSFPAIPLT